MHARSSALNTFAAELRDEQNEADVTIRTLIVDDDDLITGLFTTILTAEGYEVVSVASAEAALEVLSRQKFDIMFADIFMPGMNGFELLQRVKALAADLPVILVTGYANVDMARRALNAGASDFVTKPCNIKELPIILERNLTRQALAHRSRMTHKHELQSSYETVLDALLSALDTRDTETEGHSERVTAYTMLMAGMIGMENEDQFHVERGALLHDIGKIGVPDRILLKPSSLTNEEWIEMRKHPTIGYHMCSRINFLTGAAEIVLHHHERWDGKGYPTGISKDDIPLGARIFAVVDAFDAMSTDRIYRKAMPFECIREEIKAQSCQQFDPNVVDVFLSVPETRWQEIRTLSGR